MADRTLERNAKIEFLKKEISRLEKVRDRFMSFDMDDMAQLVSSYIKSLKTELENPEK